MPSPEPAEGLHNPLDGLLGYQLRRASIAMLADLAATLADLDLRVTDASILVLLQANPNVSQSDIGRVLGIQRTNIVPLIAALLRRQLLERSKGRGRAQALLLTEAGAALAAECLRRIVLHEARFLPALAPAERGRFVDSVRAIWDRARE